MNNLLLEVNNIKVYKQGEFHYSLSQTDSDAPTLDRFDIRDLPNWGWNPRTKMAKELSLHSDVIQEALYHGHLNEFLSRNGLTFN